MFCRIRPGGQAILKNNFSDPEHPKTLLVDGDRAFTWGKNVMTLLRSVFGKDSEQYQQFTNTFRGEIYYNWLKDYLSIFKSIYENYEKSLIKASTVDDVLEQWKMLLGSGEKDAACIMTGIALETAMRELCRRNTNIPPGDCSQASEQINLSLYKTGN